MDDMSIVPRLTFESRLTLKFVAWLGYAKVMRALDESIVQGCAQNTI